MPFCSKGAAHKPGETQGGRTPSWAVGKVEVLHIAPSGQPELSKAHQPGHKKSTAPLGPARSHLPAGLWGTLPQPMPCQPVHALHEPALPAASSWPRGHTRAPAKDPLPLTSVRGLGGKWGVGTGGSRAGCNPFGAGSLPWLRRSIPVPVSTEA